MKKLFCIFGVILFSFPLFQMIPSSIEMYRILNTENDADLNLWQAMKTITAYSASLSAAGTGIIVMGINVDVLEYKPKWLFTAMIILGLIWSLCYPYGVAIGGVLLVYAIGKRKKFKTTPEKL